MDFYYGDSACLSVEFSAEIAQKVQEKFRVAVDFLVLLEDVEDHDDEAVGSQAAGVGRI